MIHAPEHADWLIASITAHRDLADDDVAIIHNTMYALIASGVDAICFGGARGGDTAALQAALYFRQGPKPWLTVVVPDTIEKQPKDTQFWIRKADEVIELRNPITKKDYFASYAIRDQYLVDVASVLVAFYNGRRTSGTGQTVGMAEKRGIEVKRIPIKGKAG